MSNSHRNPAARQPDIIAGMATTGLGYTCLPLNPTFWVITITSGDHTPNSGNYSTFNQLFPPGHYYQGWADLLAGRTFTI
jgi:hypothetical protein